jgi:hypothetical protein
MPRRARAGPPTDGATAGPPARRARGAVLMMMVLSMVPVKVVAMAAVATMTAVATHLVLVEEVIIGRGKNGNLYGRLGAVGENSGCQFLDTSVYCEIILQFHFIARGGLEGFCR